VRRVAATVFLLGVVSMLTDISSEMVGAVLPLYLTAELGMGLIAYGFVDGLYQGVSAVLRIAGGYVGDRRDRPKWVATAGYSVSALSRLAMLPAHGPALLTAVVTADRLGKGLRTAPRDALIADITEPDMLGRAFGVHRALDTLGAAIGPLAAFAVLLAVPDGYSSIWVVSFAFAIVGVAVMVLAVPDRRADPGTARPAARGLLRAMVAAGLRGPLVAFALLGLCTVGDGFLYLSLQRRDGFAALWFPLLYVGTNVAYLFLTAVSAGPHVVFRSTAQGAGDARLAVASLADPDGPRAFIPASCDRAYGGRDGTVCLLANRGNATTYRVRTLDGAWNVDTDAPLGGLLSRARLSPDGSLIATTTFVYGDSYTNPGQFSIRTLISRAGGGQLSDLEQFTLLVDGRQVTAADRNLWGVTFADDDTFYATAATSGRTWLVRGSIAGRRLTSIRAAVECPSLSPDGTRIAFKKHGSLPPGQWRLAVSDLATGRETLLAEQRNVDDQVEWLDNGTVLYGLPRTRAATQDVWEVPADGTGAARVFVHDAWSPSVVR
jgi:hypothetical protein